mgnify:CR=1 FL=1
MAKILIILPDSDYDPSEVALPWFVWCQAGHEVWVESQAGAGIGVSDLQYQAAGAHIAPTAAEVFTNAELIVKVKEPQAEEYRRLIEGTVKPIYEKLKRQCVEESLSRPMVAYGYFRCFSEAPGGNMNQPPLPKKVVLPFFFV